MTLRPYQQEAVEAVEAEFAKPDIRSTLIVLATGCGKTIIFSHLAAREVLRGGRVLILAHRGELLEQAIKKLEAATGIVAGLEKAEETSEVGDNDLPFTVVVGSVQSMKSERRLARFSPDEFSLIVIDECHHALT
jgi:superfamily II DNA or RNA helicase